MLIEAEANVDSLDYHGSTALMEAVWKKRTEIVKLLIKYGANVNVMNRKSSTALSLAALGERDEIVRMLVKAGAVGVGGVIESTGTAKVVKTNEAESSIEAAAMKGSKKQDVLNYTECIEHAGLKYTAVEKHNRAEGLINNHISTSNANNKETTPKFFHN